MFSIPQKFKAFTLVELIVVITILAILGTIGFLSYSSYLVGARDSNRVTQLQDIANGLNTYSVKSTLPLPDKYVTVLASGSIIAYQGYMGQSQLDLISYNKGGKDPKDQEYFTYYLSADKKSFQLFGYLEDVSNQTAGIFPTAYAADYTNRYITTIGKKLGVLTEAVTNQPIQAVSSIVASGGLDIATTTGLYNAYVTNTIKISGSGSSLKIFANPTESCKTLLALGNGSSGLYTINPGKTGNVTVYCDMTTNGGGRTLVFVTKGAESIDVYTFPLTQYSTDTSRDYLSSTTFGNTRAATYKLLRNWPLYTQLLRERWLPSSLTSRTYILNGFGKSSAYIVSNSDTNVNYLSSERTNIQGWDFTLVNAGQCNAKWVTTPNAGKLYRDGCCGCASGYMYVPLGAWNGFFPDVTYGFWRISNGSSDYNQHRTDYDNLANGNAMPGYGLYVR